MLTPALLVNNLCFCKRRRMKGCHWLTGQIGSSPAAKCTRMRSSGPSRQMGMSQSTTSTASLCKSCFGPAAAGAVHPAVVALCKAGGEGMEGHPLPKSDHLQWPWSSICADNACAAHYVGTCCCHGCCFCCRCVVVCRCCCCCRMLRDFLGSLKRALTGG